MTNIPLLIGKTSDDSFVHHDLISMHHLFISYSDNTQFHRFLSDATNNLNGQREQLHFAAAVSKECYRALGHLMFNDPQARHFIKEGERSASKQEFMRSLIAILKYRHKHKADNKSAPPRIIVLIEDVFDLVIPDKKGLGNQFLQLLLEGPALGIHMIIGSIRTYRNLLTQLIHLDLNPKLRKQFGYHFQNGEAIGAELILNTDDLVFFKSRHEHDYRRYFSAREGISVSNY